MEVWGGMGWDGVVRGVVGESDDWSDTCLRP